MRGKAIALLVLFSLVLNLFVPWEIYTEAAVHETERVGNTDSASSLKKSSRQKELEAFDREWKNRLQKQRQEIKEKKRMQGTRKKRGRGVAEAEVLSSSMAELLQEDGSYREAGAGSEILIEDAQDLKCLGEYTEMDCNTQGVIFRQTEDIDCAGVTMGVIGVSKWSNSEEDFYTNCPFSGTYDGGSHHISNVFISDRVQEVYHSGRRIGLFGNIAGATIKNVILDSIDFARYDQNTDYGVVSDLKVGLLIGTAEGSVIENCINYADFSAPEEFSDIAGIVYMIDNTVTLRNCSNYGNLGCLKTDGFSIVAGIVVDGWGKEVCKCINYGELKNASLVAGIATFLEGTVTDCENRGTLRGKEYVSGIAHNSEDGLLNCKNSGNLFTENGMASGIVDNHNDSIIGCENTGDIQGAYQAGGIARQDYRTEIRRCKNTGKINAVYRVGGIVGELYYGVISDCTNEGEVYSQGDSGGIVGIAEYAMLMMCTNRGKVEGKNTAGGIVGYSKDRGALCNLLNYGDVVSVEDAGGILGSGSQNDIINAWNHGSVTGQRSAGGILGNADLLSLFEWEYGEGEDEQDEEGDKGESEAWKVQYVNDGQRILMANSLKNCINIGGITSQKVSGAIIGTSDLKDTIEYCYYQDGSSSRVHGTNTTAEAKCIEKNEWNQEAFVEELNRNTEAMDNGAAFSIEYSSKQGIRWKQVVVVAAESYSQYNVHLDQTVGRFISRSMIDFVLLRKSTGEYVSMTGEHGIFSAEVSPGEEYEIFRILPDGTYQSQGESIRLQKEDYISIFSKTYQVFQEIVQVSVQKQADGTQILQYGEPFYSVAFEKISEIILSEEPKREGYVFGGWYTIPDITIEELYLPFQENLKIEFAEQKAAYEDWYERYGEDKENFGSKEEYAQYYLKEQYGYSTLEELLANIDSYLSKEYKVDSLIEKWVQEEDRDEGYLTTPIVFAKWDIPSPSVPTPGDGEQTQNILYKDIDPFDYMEPAGSMMKKAGVIYKLDRKKKTAQVTGVSSIFVKQIVVQGRISYDGVNYRVTSIGKRAFSGCKNLKKITVKGKNLKRVHRTALKGANKKMVIKGNKKIKKLFKK